MSIQVRGFLNAVAAAREPVLRAASARMGQDRWPGDVIPLCPPFYAPMQRKMLQLTKAGASVRTGYGYVDAILAQKVRGVKSNFQLFSI
jgi:hypothetical protein